MAANPRSKVGFLHTGSSHSFKKPYSAFLGALADLVGEEEDVEVHARWVADGGGTLAEQAASLIAMQPEVIVAAGGPLSALELQKQTSKIKIVFTSVMNPAGLGLVGDLDKPTGNITGIAGLTTELDFPRLELLLQVVQVPSSGTPKRIGVITYAGRVGVDDQFTALQAEVTKRGLNITLDRKDIPRLATLANIETAFAELKSSGAEGILVTADPFFNNLRREIVELAKGIPAIYQWREFAEAGGLMSFGPNISEAYVMAAEYVAELLVGGKKVRDLPVLEPNTFELVINTNSPDAKKVPKALFDRAELLGDSRRKKSNKKLSDRLSGTSAVADRSGPGRNRRS
jgi:putative ABC transport system substrate-binding protein